MWLDASDFITISSTNNKVSQWRDKSGFNRHANQGTAANQPTYIASTSGSGKPGIYFDGVMSGMTYTGGLTAPYSIFIVFNINRPISESGLVTLTGTNSDGGAGGPYIGRSFNEYYQSWAQSFLAKKINTSSLVYPNKTNLVVLSSHFQSGNHRLNINREMPSGSSDTLIFNMGSSMTLGYQLGFGRTITGTIHEMIIYQGINVSQWESQRLQIENYLQAKWY